MKRHPVCACSVAVALGVTVGLGALPARPADGGEGPSHEASPVEAAHLTEEGETVSAAKRAADTAAKRALRARLGLSEAQRRHRKAVAELERVRQRVESLAGTAFTPSWLTVEHAEQARSYPDLLTAQRARKALNIVVSEADEQVRRRTVALAVAEAERKELAQRYEVVQAAARQTRARLAAPTAAREQRAAASRGTPRWAAAPRSVLSMPVEGRKSSDYGHRLNPYSKRWQFHAGVDIAAPGGTPIRAAADGTVTRAGWSGGYGNYTCLAHRDGLSTCYAHQSQILVKPGERVSRDELIGRVGTTGASTGNHLHFEVRRNGTPADPLAYLPAFD